MKISGIILQVCGVLIMIAGIIGGVVALIPRPSNGISILAMIIGAIAGGVFLVGIGSAFRLFENMALDIERTADATERAADILTSRRKPPPETPRVFEYEEVKDEPKQSSPIRPLK